MTAVTKYADLLPLLVADLPGCPENVIVQALRQAARKFCIDSEAWVADAPVLSVVADQQSYTLTPTWGADIRRIVEVRINTADGVTNHRIGRLLPAYCYHFAQPSTLVFEENYIPNIGVTNALNIKYALVPQLLGADNGIDWNGFFIPWMDGLCDRARADLMLMPTKVWSNVKLGTYFDGQYWKSVNRAKVEVERRYTDMTPTVTA